jgi:hypothetical protein
MLRPDLIPIEIYLADALSYDFLGFCAHHPWPVLVIPEPDWEKIRQLGRPETLGGSALFERLLDPDRPGTDGASLDALALPLRPKGGGDPSRITLGRAPDADVILLDDTISKHHAEISWELERERCRITDLGSKNGTHIDSIRIEPRVHADLLSGAVVAFGSLLTRYYPPRAFYEWLGSGAARSGAAPAAWPR